MSEVWQAGAQPGLTTSTSSQMSEASSPVLSSAGRLIGRDREREVLGRLLDGVREGRGGLLVLHGEPGVGKTALLEYAVRHGPEFRIARTSGVEAEMELPFAAAQQLCSSFLDLLDRLPRPQHEALGVAFGLIGEPARPAPNPFFVGLAFLGLLSEAAEEQPLLAVVDDAQWLDQASRGRWHSWLAACWPRRSRSCSPRASSPARSRAFRHFTLGR